jgi:UDP-glucose 4-epimerase
MHILVTGGAGFIGSHTVVALAEAGFQPVLLDDFSNAEPSVLEGLEAVLGHPVVFYEGDCGDTGLLRRVFSEQPIRGVVHFAAYKAVGESMLEPLKYYRNNLVGLLALLEASLEAGVSPFLFSSSCTVYGIPETVPVTEQTPVLPALSVYGNTKQIGEEILRDAVGAGNHLKVMALRYFNPIGAHPSARIGELPRGVPNNLVPYLVQAAAGLRPPLTVYGDDYDTPDGSGVRDYIHVMDLAEAHVAALKHLLKLPDAPQYDVVNVGTGSGVSVFELIRAFERVTGIKVPYGVGPRRAGDVPMVYADAGKAAQLLGWRAQRSIDEALTDVWRWQQYLMTPTSKS